MVGTLGHIDHGKTELVKALTGIDCDRWSEEKERGITIDIGFAHLHHGDLQVGFIDVPGHERFLHNALAGLGGIRLALLVVAATEGVMPQTREHLEIGTLLEIPSLVVALTKTDLVSDDLIELAELELHELLEATPFAGARILRVSSVTGEGIDELRAELLELGARHVVPKRPNDPVRLPLDRAFQLRGLGAIVTGTLVSGAIRTGDELEVLPSHHSVRVRSIQVHSEERDRAHAGERTSLRVTGVDFQQLERGQQLLTPGTFSKTKCVCARYTHLDSAPLEIDEPTEIRAHLFSSEVVGTLRPLHPHKLAPGGSGIVEIRLHRPVVAVRDDRIIVRRLSPATTLGGGRVLDPFWRRPRSRAISSSVKGLDDSLEEAILHWIQSAGHSGLTTQDLIARVSRSLEETEALLTGLTRSGRLQRVPGGTGRLVHWISSPVLDQIAEKAVKILESYFHRNRLAEGMPKAHFVKSLVGGLSVHLTDYYLGVLQSSGVLLLRSDLVLLPNRRVELSSAEALAVKEILELLERGGLSPPIQVDLREALSPAATGAFEAAVEYLSEIGKVVRLSNQELLSAAAVNAAQKELLDEGIDKVSVQEFKDRFGLTRKWAIPLLEHLDSIGFTRRVGDTRLVSQPR